MDVPDPAISKSTLALDISSAIVKIPVPMVIIKEFELVLAEHTALLIPLIINEALTVCPTEELKGAYSIHKYFPLGMLTVLLFTIVFPPADVFTSLVFQSDKLYIDIVNLPINFVSLQKRKEKSNYEN